MVTHPVNPISTFRFTYEKGLPKDKIIYMYQVYYCSPIPNDIPITEDFVSIFEPHETRYLPMYVYAKDNYIQIDINFSEMEKPAYLKSVEKIIEKSDNYYSSKMSFPERLLYKFKLWKAKLFNKDDLGF